MEPNSAKAIEVLEAVADQWNLPNLSKTDLWCAVINALGWLRGYKLPPEVLEKYRCTFCGVSGIKLWRAIHSAQEAWCCKCGGAQAGLPDLADEQGKWPSQLDGQRTDQIYSPRKGCNLLPWVPAPDGETWGYTSVPPEGCEWWRRLPTRKEAP